MKYLSLFFVILLIGLVGIVTADTTVRLNASEWGSPGYDSGTTARTFIVLMDTAGNSGDYSAYAHSFQRSHSSTANRYIKAERTSLIFNITAAVPSTATVTGATLVTVIYLNDNGLGTPKWTLTMSSPTDPLVLANADYNYAKYTNTTLSPWYTHPPATEQYYNYTLNTNGTQYLESISNRSISSVYANLSIRDHWDFYKVFNGTWAAASTTRNAIYTQTEVNTTRHPYLLITYTDGVSAPVSSFTLQRSLYRIPETMQANDTSTNTPTTWNWSWGDGTWTNGTTRNATHKYTTRGMFAVKLLCSNAGGSDTSDTATKVRIVGYAN